MSFGSSSVLPRTCDFRRARFWHLNRCNFNASLNWDQSERTQVFYPETESGSGLFIPNARSLDTDIVGNDQIDQRNKQNTFRGSRGLCLYCFELFHHTSSHEFNVKKILKVKLFAEKFDSKSNCLILKPGLIDQPRLHACSVIQMSSLDASNIPPNTRQ